MYRQDLAWLNIWLLMVDILTVKRGCTAEKLSPSTIALYTQQGGRYYVSVRYITATC